MNSFEQGFRRPIPLDKAASYFLGLKSWQGPSAEDRALFEEVEKQANAFARAKELLTGSKAKALASEATHALQTGQGVKGTLRDAAREARSSRRTQLGAAAVGGAAAGVAAGSLGKKKESHARFRLLAMLYKTAAEDSETTSGGTSRMSSPAPTAVPQEQEYLDNERAGLEAEANAALQYYQERLNAMRAELTAAQESSSALEQQVATLTQQQQAHDTQVQAAQTEGQIAQQAALQQVQAANVAASQAMQQAVDAENRALQAKGSEAASKIQQQQVRSQLFDLASQGLPGTEPPLGEAGDAAGGLDPSAAPVPAEGDPAQAGAPDAGMNQEGQAAPDAVSTAPAGNDPSQDAAAAPPGAVQPPADSSGGAGSGASTGPQASGDGSASAPEQDPSAKRTGQVSIKVGRDMRARLDRVLRDRGVSEASLDAELERAEKVAAGLPSYLRDPKLIGALAGGVGGAGLAALEASGHGPDLGKIRDRIQANEGAGGAGTGGRGFVRALALAKDKAMLTLGEATQNHPVAATLTGGLLGATAGAGAGKEVGGLLREAASLRGGG